MTKWNSVAAGHATEPLTPTHTFTMACPVEATKPLTIATAAGWVHIEPGTEITFEIRDGIWRVREP